MECEFIRYRTEQEALDRDDIDVEVERYPHTWILRPETSGIASVLL